MMTSCALATQESIEARRSLTRTACSEHSFRSKSAGGGRRNHRFLSLVILLISAFACFAQEQGEYADLMLVDGHMSLLVGRNLNAHRSFYLFPFA